MFRLVVDVVIATVVVELFTLVLAVAALVDVVLVFASILFSHNIP